MKRTIGLAAIAAAALLALSPAAAHASFGFKEGGLAVTFQNRDGSPAVEAGSHPFSMTTSLSLNTRPDPGVGFEVPDGDART